MTSETNKIAEMVNQANYAAMSYNELVTINFAYHLAVLDIKPLIEKKRVEEMERHTDAYVGLMDNYGASKAEVLALIEKKAMREVPYGPAPSKDVAEQAPTVDTEDYQQDNDESVLALPAPSKDVAEQDPTVDTQVNQDNQDNDESVLALPAPSHSIPEDVADSTQEKEPSNDTAVAVMTHQEIAERAIKLAKMSGIPDTIEVNAPYFVDYSFDYNDKGDLELHRKQGRNLKENDLESYRLAADNYYRLFLKQEVAISTIDCLVVIVESRIVVTFYNCPTDGEAQVPNIDADGNYILNMDEKALKRKKCALRKAIKYVKDNYKSEEIIERPCQERFTFKIDGRTIDCISGPVIIDEEADVLPGMLSSFETYAKFNSDRNYVMSKDNIVAATRGRHIYLLRINTPVQEKKRKTTKKVVPVNKDSVTSTEDPLIAKGVNLTKAQHGAYGVDFNAPYFIQCEFSVTGDGELLQKGMPFIKNVSGEEEFEKLKKHHLRFAKTMKAVNLISTDQYTSYFWNEGKNLCVFYYNTKGLTAAA